MSSDLRLVVFDVDGTLVDSQSDIVGAMGDAFAAVGRSAPARAEILGIVGLSLPEAIARLSGADGGRLAAMVAAYKDSYAARRAAAGSAASSPFYPGVSEVLEEIHAVPHWLMGVATGKSRRGLDALLTSMGLSGRFVTEQVADDHPSKPHPAMLYAALAETGLDPEDAVMVGDTEYDMEMARAAGLVFIGVTWGYHPRERLAGADYLIDEIGALPRLLNEIWSER